MQFVFSDIYVWPILDHFLFAIVTRTNSCMHTVTILYIDYSGNLQYKQNVSNKYILIREFLCILIVRNKPTIPKNIMLT